MNPDRFTWPVVIPPVQTKDPFIRSFFPAVWQDARDALSRADRVVFFGYSLPRLDIASEKMFQRSLSKNQSIEFLDVVDPAPASADRYAGLLGTLPIRWYPNAPAFLDLFE